MIYKPISVAIAAEIDYNSFGDNGFSSFFEMRSMIDCVKFELYKDNQIYYDSENPSKELSFALVKAIYDTICAGFGLSKDETIKFQEECKLFLKNESLDYKMPYELLIARNIFNGTINLNLSDFENMDIKKYEKIQLALSILQEQVKDTIAE